MEKALVKGRDAVLGTHRFHSCFAVLLALVAGPWVVATRR
jgi:hypothetical protein